MAKRRRGGVWSVSGLPGVRDAQLVEVEYFFEGIQLSARQLGIDVDGVLEVGGVDGLKFALADLGAVTHGGVSALALSKSLESVSSEFSSLSRGRLFWVTPAMVEVAVEASGSVVFEPGLVAVPPWEFGFMGLGRDLPPLVFPSSRGPVGGEREVRVCALSWASACMASDRQAVAHVTFYARADAAWVASGGAEPLTDAPLVDVAVMTVPLEEGLGCFAGRGALPEGADVSGYDLAGKFVVACWELMGQERVSEVREVDARTGQGVEVSRGAGMKRVEQNAVRLVDMRPLKHVHVVRDEVSGRVFTHRWVVRGHWRNQPVGPKRGQRRRQWIPAYTKGPDGAPMVAGREDVYVWRR